MTPEELAAFDGPDAPDVVATEQMWRRILPHWIVDDHGSPAGSRVSTAAFEESKNPPSPCSLIRALESAAEQVQKSPENAVGAISATVIRARGFKLVRHDDPNEPGHFHMVGPNDKKNADARRARLALAGQTKWVAGPRWGPGIAPPP